MVWRYEAEGLEQVAKAVQNTKHLAAHVAYFAGEEEASRDLYRGAIEKFIPKIEVAERTRPARVVLGVCARVALYAWRADSQEALSTLWERWGLAYAVDGLDEEAAGLLCVLAVLAHQEDSKHTREAAARLPEGSLIRRVLAGLSDTDQRDSAVAALDTHFEDYGGDGVAARPWDDEALIGCYERLHAAAGTDWKAARQS